jgi:hypothetical protein
MRLLLLTLALATSAAIGGYLYLGQPSATNTAPMLPAVKVVMPVLERLTSETITWADIAALVEQVSSDGEDKARIVASITSEHPPVVYLKAMLEITLRRETDALLTFAAIDLDKIPATYLYLPFRITENVAQQANRYQAPVYQAALEQRLEAIQNARILTRLGLLNQAFTHYLKTDPATWARYDVNSLRLLSMHDGLRHETGEMLVAAIMAGRLKDNVKTEIIALLAERGDVSEAQKAQLRLALQTDSKARGVVVSAVREIFELRALFMDKAFSEITMRFESKPTQMVTDEANILIFIAAAATKNELQISRWGQELKRRFPDEETEAWLRSMKERAS